jgi:mannose-6-phosphate isomerase-like protein (cupin superfamily)
MRSLALVGLMATAGVACGYAHPATLVWEGRGPARSGPTTAAAVELPSVGPGTRRGPWGEATDASYQLVESDRAEDPHLHARHDLTVVLLSGRGTLTVEDRRYDLRAGDVAQIARGKVHAFAPSGRAVALAIFTPRLEGADYVPASAGGNAAVNAR